MSTVVVRSGLPRVLRSPLTETWYVASAPYTVDGKAITTGKKREVHPDDAGELEQLYADYHREWPDCADCGDRFTVHEARDPVDPPGECGRCDCTGWTPPRLWNYRPGGLLVGAERGTTESEGSR